MDIGEEDPSASGFAPYNEYDKYVVDATELKIIKTPDDILNPYISFRPELWYQFLSSDGHMVGFKDLKIKLYYTAGWMFIYGGLEFTSKLDSFEPSNVIKEINHKFELEICENIDSYYAAVDANKSFRPFGTQIKSFQAPAMGARRNVQSTYDIYTCSADSEDFIAYFKRVQTLLLQYIDGVSFIDIDDSSWKFFFVYEKYKTDDNNTAFATAGFITVYEYYAYPDRKRPRISQVLIFPPYQKRGICSALVKSIYDFYEGRQDILDFTVEDPTEKFTRVRDFVDCSRVKGADYLSPDQLCPANRKVIIDKLHSDYKLNKRQARRVYEILRLSNINMASEEEFELYKQEVMGRLNIPFQRAIKIKPKVVGKMTEQEIKDTFIEDKLRIAQLEAEFSDLVPQYMAIVMRLQQ